MTPCFPARGPGSPDVLRSEGPPGIGTLGATGHYGDVDCAPLDERVKAKLRRAGRSAPGIINGGLTFELVGLSAGVGTGQRACGPDLGGRPQRSEIGP